MTFEERVLRLRERLADLQSGPNRNGDATADELRLFNQWKDWGDRTPWDKWSDWKNFENFKDWESCGTY